MTMKMTITVKMDNAAFARHENDDFEVNGVEGFELARQLRELATKIEESILEDGDQFLVNDINGNKTLLAVVEE